MGKITKYLNQLIIGNVFDTPELLDAYSTDRSILKIKPKFVAFPESTDDIRKLLKFFDQISRKDIGVSITPRGGGTSEDGSSLSSGLIISTAKLNKMLEFDPRERLVRVQAGITLQELNTALSVSGLTIPIEGHADSTIGGLIASSPIDDYSSKYGGIERYVRRLEAVLPNGEILQTSRLNKYQLAKKVTEKTTEGEIYHQLIHLLKSHEKIIENFRGAVAHDKRGYPSITGMSYRESIDLLPLFFGSQGTLGIISEVILHAVPIPTSPLRVVATFKKLDQALEFAHKVELIGPRTVNLFDIRILQEVRKSGKNLDGVLRKMEDGFVIYASFDERPAAALKKVAALQKTLPRSAKFIYDSPKERATLDEFENALAPYLVTVKNKERIPVLTDFYMPPQTLGALLTELTDLERKTGLDLALYGSPTTSIYHVRPRFRLDDDNFGKKVTAFLKTGASVITKHGGSFIAGSPEGRLRAVVANATLDPDQRIVYQEVKRIFDPHNILNPDVKLGADAKFTLSHLRTGSLPKIVL